ncbi:hypothetical protein A3J32_01025 [Candidatus Saccharibacteria bacterium RIFCSPLOWO2_02_FULL_46_7]|nr:MAG: hypothetical protein A3J32_01025 [Candidatus Saccharibacteria bacterium RIFCSPLOWO2_02_FULL_46_7]
MDAAAEVLLIIVSATLAVFLIIFSIALIFLIRVFRRAAEVADSVESAASAVKKGVTAMPVINLVSKIISRKRRV